MFIHREFIQDFQSSGFRSFHVSCSPVDSGLGTTDCVPLLYCILLVYSVYYRLIFFVCGFAVSVQDVLLYFTFLYYKKMIHFFKITRRNQNIFLEIFFLVVCLSMILISFQRQIEPPFPYCIAL